MFIAYLDIQCAVLFKKYLTVVNSCRSHKNERTVWFDLVKPRHQKKFEHLPNPVVYYSMNNFSERFDARLHGAGINDEENAGRYSKTDERHIGRQRFGLSLRTVGATSWSGEGYGLLVVSAPDNTAPHYPRHHRNPYIEEKARLRSQQLYFGGGELPT